MRQGKLFHASEGCASTTVGFALLLLASSSGCYSGYAGSQESSADTDASDDGAEDGAGAEESTGGDDGGEPADACADAGLGATVLRRLTSREYANTVRDLFGVDAPVEMLPSDGRPGSFRTTSGQALTPGTTTKYFDAARFVAEARAAADPEWFPCASDDECVEDYLRDEGLRLFRRPLEGDEISRYRDIFSGRLEDGDTPSEAADTMLQAMLVSPHFLFVELPTGAPGERVALDNWQLASRLSFLIWASTPDDALLEAAGAGELSNPDARAEAAERLLEDPRAEAAVDSFFMQWTTAENISLVSRDLQEFPDVVPELTAALEEESRLYFREVFWNRGARLEELFTSPVRVRNGALSAYYGDDLVPADQTEFTVVEADVDDHGFGILSQAGMLMAIGRNPETQIIYRGEFVQNKLLCNHITLAATDTVPPLPQIDPTATSREQVTQHTQEATCAGCHTMLNPPGFAMEHFDASGRWRDDERGLEIDASAELIGVTDGPVNGALEFSRALAASERVQTCAVDQMFEFAIGRQPNADDQCVTDELTTALLDSGGDLQALLVEIVASPAFALRVSPEE